MKIINIPSRIITNPFYIYAISFIIVLSFFLLKWSIYYKYISFSLFLFIVLTSGIAIFLGKHPLIKKKNVFHYIPISSNNRLIWRIIVIGYLGEFIYCHSIPFVDVVIGGLGKYRDFEGIPMFHVLISYINLFWGIYIFIQYQSNRGNNRLRKYVIYSYIPSILLLNRGAIIYLLFSSIFIYLMRINSLSGKKIIYFVIGGLCFLLLFGLMGDVRDAQSQQDNTYILRIGGATDDFINSNIPKSLFWGYMYIASPIGNTQNAIDHAQPHITSDNFVIMLMESCCPDFISKRLLSVFSQNESSKSKEYLVNPIFNAPAVYYQPYIRLGWTGMIWMFLFMIIVIYVYIYMTPSSSVFFLVGWSSLLTTITLNTFNNMWVYGGLTIVSMVLIITFISQFKKKYANR